ncbi:MAG: methyltransferase domain-containing protein, partial [Planctomycetaceae bacterium]
AVRERYSNAAQAAEAALCCPVDYDRQYLEVVPDEIIERDYGCGDPSKHLVEGDTVLDLGSGGGKICYIASQVVGSTGRVIGVDCNEEMLELATKYQAEVAEKIGYSNVEFRKGRIQDLKLNLGTFEQWLTENPVRSAGDWMQADAHAATIRDASPLVEDDSVTAVVSNCVLNLVRNEDRKQLFAEIFRVLKRGGRAIISDIVCDEDVPVEMQNDPRLWSGCLSGAFREDAFLTAFEEAGFYGVEILSRQEEPWAVIEGIEFRSMTVRAYKGKEGQCLDRNHAVVYRGPWKTVVDDDGQTLHRGQRMAVCEKNFGIYTKGPYANSIVPVPPAVEVPLHEAGQFDCNQTSTRPAAATKQGGSVSLNVLPGGDCCGGSTDCC